MASLINGRGSPGLQTQASAAPFLSAGAVSGPKPPATWSQCCSMQKRFSNTPADVRELLCPPSTPSGLSGHLPVKQHFSGGAFHETQLEVGASSSSGGDLCGAHPPTPQPALTLQSLKATNCPSVGDGALLRSGWGRRVSHRGAGAEGAAACHTRESMAYIWPVAVRPQGWGSCWGCQWLLGSARTEWGCVAASDGSRAQGGATTWGRSRRDEPGQSATVWGTQENQT